MYREMFMYFYDDEICPILDRFLDEGKQYVLVQTKEFGECGEQVGKDGRIIYVPLNDTEREALFDAL